MAFRFLFFSVLSAMYFSAKVEGHGFMLDPINRASLWRVDWTQPTNYNDNEYFCGGTHVQYDLNGGKCGPCGDDFRDPVPRSNENTGTFGNGIIVANYTEGQVIEVTSLITANHLGSLYFQLCELQVPSQPETEECFKPLRLIDGTKNHPINALDQRVTTQVKLPDGFSCERCVFRWHYRTGNSWGICDDGTQNMGCGNQEIFRSCADIRINPSIPEYVPYEYSFKKVFSKNHGSDKVVPPDMEDNLESKKKFETPRVSLETQNLEIPSNPHAPRHYQFRSRV